ncbi:MAG: insulinase family protein [Bdellovibrionales bacterium]|nr:insulinase family protein [Bdellovibrionales bacterium]
MSVNLKKLSVIFVSAMAFLLVSCATTSLNKNVEIKKFEETALSNGLPLLMMKDDSLPYFSVILLIKSGSASDPDGQKGVSRMVAKTLERGTSKRSAEQIAESFDQIGASFSASVSNDFTTVTASGLAFHKEQILDNFAEVVTQPAFSMKEIRKMKSLTLAKLQQAVDEPSSFIGLAMSDYLYGDHPYGSPTTGSVKDIKKMKKRHIIRQYLGHFRPNNAHLAVVGNFDPNVVKKSLEAKFKDWAKRDVPQVDVPGFPEVKGLSIRLIDKTDLKQSQIRFGGVGISRKHPDFLKLRVANTILGGAFKSRLVDKIRAEKGLTYSIYSRFDARKEEGPFMVSTFTRHEKVKETINETLDVIKNFRDKGVTKQEVEDAKNLLKGSFPRSIETPEALVQNLLYLRFYGISDDYLKDYISTIDKISMSDVNDVIKKHFDTENMKVLVYSSKKEVMSQLKDIGEVSVLPYKKALN